MGGTCITMYPCLFVFTHTPCQPMHLLIPHVSQCTLLSVNPIRQFYSFVTHKISNWGEWRLLIYFLSYWNKLPPLLWYKHSFRVEYQLRLSLHLQKTGSLSVVLSRAVIACRVILRCGAGTDISKSIADGRGTNSDIGELRSNTP